MVNHESTIESIIDNKFASLSKSMKKIAVELRRDWVGMAFLSASRIGEVSGVSEATVHRLALALNFNSFSDMQEFIKSKVIENRTILRLKSSTETSRGRMFRPDHALLTDIKNLQKTIDDQQNAQIWAAAEMIQRACRIHVAGWKASISVSGFLAYSLHFMLGNCSFIHQGELAERIAVLESGDLFVAIGFPRYASILLKGVEMARKRNARIVVITDSPISPYCQFADVSLFAATASDGFLDSYTAPLSLSNSLIQSVSHLCKERVLEHLEKMENGLKELSEMHLK